MKAGEIQIDRYHLMASQDPIIGKYQQILHWTVKDKPSRFVKLQILAIPMIIPLDLLFWINANSIGNLPKPAVKPPGFSCGECSAKCEEVRLILNALELKGEWL